MKTKGMHDHNSRSLNCAKPQIIKKRHAMRTKKDISMKNSKFPHE